MKISGKFTIVKTNILTGETSTVESGNIMTNAYYDVLRDGSNQSIGLYIWTSPKAMIKTRRRVNVEVSENFLNNAYGYMPSTDWFARYVQAEDNQPGYFETRTRLDPPETGTRTIKSILLTDRKSRVDNVTGLLPEYAFNTITDVTNPNSNITMTKHTVFAFTTLDTACIQSEIEVYDVYYRVIFDNNYSDINMTDVAIEMVGKQSTAKMPTIQRNGSNLKSTFTTIPALSRAGPVNFTLGTLAPLGRSVDPGDSWYDYDNIFDCYKISNKYVTTYGVDLTKDIHVGKIINTIYPNGVNSASFVSGFKSIYENNEITVKNTHSHKQDSPYPYFDPSNVAQGLGYCTMNSVQVPSYPEWIEAEIVDSGTLNSASYILHKMPFLGTFKNTYSPLSVEIPHISQMVVHNGTWRGGVYYNGTDDMHGFLTYRAGTHPSSSGLVFESSGLQNGNFPVSRMAVPGYSGFREYSDSELIGYDPKGISILNLNGAVRSINKFKSSSFIPEDICQVETDKDTGYIYVVCRSTGVYRLNSSFSLSDKVVPTGIGGTEGCYGFQVYQNKMLAFFETEICLTLNGGASWTKYPHPDYSANGLDKTKLCGIRANLTGAYPEVLMVFSDVDGGFTTDRRKILAAWWSPYVFNVLNASPGSMQTFGASPSYFGIDYVKFYKGKFYLIFHSAASYSTVISSIPFNTSTMTNLVSYYNSSTDGLPKFFSKNGADYILYLTGSTIGLYSITNYSMVGSISGYGQKGQVNTYSMNGFSPFYYAAMSNGLIIIRGTSDFSQNIYNGSTPNIVHEVIRESAEIITTKIINPFFNSSMKNIITTHLGWDGNQFIEGATAAKTISLGKNEYDGISFDFTGFGQQNDFLSGEKFTTVRMKGFIKDNASLAKIFFSNSNYVKSERRYQSGQITEDLNFYDVGRFDEEEGNVTYNGTHFLFDSRNTPYEFFRLAKIPREAGTFKIVVDDQMNSAYTVTFKNEADVGSTIKQFGIIVYKKQGQLYVNVSNGSVNYGKQYVLYPAVGYTPTLLSSGDTIEVSWITSTSSRLFSLKVNGSVKVNGVNFGNSESKNNSELYAYYSVSTIAYPTLSETIPVTVPKIRYDSTPTLICLPLVDFLNDDYGLSINGDNYGPGGDTHVTISGLTAENDGIAVPPQVDSTIYYSPRTILVGFCSVDNLSGTIYFTRDDQGKSYSVDYIYYKDTD